MRLRAPSRWYVADSSRYISRSEWAKRRPRPATVAPRGEQAEVLQVAVRQLRSGADGPPVQGPGDVDGQHRQPQAGAQQDPEDVGQLGVGREGARRPRAQRVGVRPGGPVRQHVHRRVTCPVHGLGDGGLTPDGTTVTSVRPDSPGSPCPPVAGRTVQRRPVAVSPTYSPWA